jgi:predicted dehydrogenase
MIYVCYWLSVTNIHVSLLLIAISLKRNNKTMEEIRWGIIGCGDVTEVKSGPAFNKVPHSKLVAVMRRDAEKAKDYATRHKVGKWFSNAHDLINDANVNAIYVATPPLQHEEYTIAALKAGKPVYVEKPMALNMDAAKRMAQASKDAGVKLSVAHYRRQLPLFRKVKELIDSNAIGDIRFVNMQMLQPNNSPLITKTSDNWRVDPKVSGGGLFHDLAPHQLDLMIYFFGKVNKASGTSLNQGGFYEADDIVQGSLLFENKILFNGLWCYTVPKEETKDTCEIIGEKGKISFSIFRHNALVIETNGDKKEMTFEVPAHVQQPMIEKVVEYFNDEGRNPCSAEDGVEVMRLIDVFTAKQPSM